MIPEMLDQLRGSNDHDFPHELLVGCEDALVLFSSGFYGRQDAFWVAQAGLTATCVDLDAEKLDEMRRGYPPDWEFVCADVFEYAAASERQWDIVTLDPWTQDFTKCADEIETWCRLAKVGVILGTGVNTVLTPPTGWVVADVRQRTTHDGGVFWSILERA